jgi:hypothetical protein
VAGSGSIKEVGSGAANQPAAIAKAATLIAELDKIIGLVMADGNRMLFRTMIRREQGTYNIYDLSVIDQFSTAVQAKALIYAGSMFFCASATVIQPNRSLFSAGDDVYFNIQGNATDAPKMIRTLRPRPVELGVRNDATCRSGPPNVMSTTYLIYCICTVSIVPLKLNCACSK